MVVALHLAVYFIYSYRIPHLQQSVAMAALIAEVRQDFNSDELLYHLMIFIDM